MTLKFKSTKIAMALVGLFVLSPWCISPKSMAQQSGKVIRLTSPGEEFDFPARGETATSETATYSAPKPDAMTASLLKMANRRSQDDRGEARPAVFTTQNLHDPNLGFAARTGFAIAPGAMPPVQQGAVIPSVQMPPIVAASASNRAIRSRDRTNSRALSDEYIFDGDDRSTPVAVDENWNITGMQTEDTFGHFDTVDGRRLVSPSNRVKIYSPRFAAVRRVDGVFNARRSAQVGSFDRQLVMQTARGKDFSSSAQQNTAPNNIESSKRASGFVDRTRGVVTDQMIQLIGVRNSFAAYENLELIKWGRHVASQSSRLQLGMQSANAWTDNLRLQAHAKGVQPIVVNDLSAAQQIISIESDGKGSVLRVTKVASKIAADVGEEVEFTIRFDNLSSKHVGNVTLVDNLTGRLQYVEGTAECSLKANFVNKVNEGGSLTLRWEIVDPVKPQKGGIIRFKCRVH